MLFAQSWTLVVVFAGILLVICVIPFLLFLWVFGPWMQAYLSRVPLSVMQILRMRLRRADVRRIVRYLIVAKQAGVDVSPSEMARADSEGVDLEKVIVAMIMARQEGKTLAFDDVVEAEREGKLAERVRRAR
ncbi:MAG: flotillin-like FloA family protein [Planctomycetota bacterium]|jgi:uncharacterized protein YqfA (UPF0365 family)